MGPYCNYCNNRCFVHMPADAPPDAVAAYGAFSILATCQRGQQFEMEKLGWNYDAILSAVKKTESAKEECAPPAQTGREQLVEMWYRVTPEPNGSTSQEEV